MRRRRADNGPSLRYFERTPKGALSRGFFRRRGLHFREREKFPRSEIVMPACSRPIDSRRDFIRNGNLTLHVGSRRVADFFPRPRKMLKTFTICTNVCFPFSF